MRCGVWSAVALWLHACSQAEPPLRVGTNVWPGYEPLYLAREIGKLPDDQVQLVELSSAADVIRLFRSGSLDVAAMTLDQVLTQLRMPEPVSIILVTDISMGADAIVAAADVPSMAALHGRRIGVEPGSVGEFLLVRALSLNAMRAADVQRVGLSASELEPALRDGRVDAVAVFEPERGRLLASGARVVFDSARIPGEILDVLVVRSARVGARAAALQTLTRGWFSALRALSESPQQAAAVMARRENVDAVSLYAVLDLLHFPGRDENAAALSGHSPGLAMAIDRVSRYAEPDAVALAQAVRLDARFVAD